ncbi:hypothetical protein [Flavobacterium sp.]|uniref:hypothetical protein n=1 Tax=Flavobacterium sp. TaxID=239 RepID=UPI0039E4091B
MSAETDYKRPSKIEGIAALLGCLIFLLLHIAATINMGFELEKMGNSPDVYENPLLRFSPMEFWLLSGIIGMVSGIMMEYRRFVIAGISGLVGGLSIVGFTMLYIGWRDSYELVETIIMLGIGIIPGLVLYNFLARKFPVKTNS